MRCLSIEIHGYRRFSMHRAQTFRMVPSSTIQLIIGTNGSGKSSLLKEITPLPPQSNEYEKTGYKITEWLHENNHYRLSAHFGTQHVHSFVREGEELNPGGTATVQKALVWQYFRISPEIHELLIGQLRIDTMSPAQRREWMTRLADTDYQYALQVFQKLKEQHRDLVGSIKLAQARRHDAIAQCLDPMSQQQLQDTIHSLTEELHRCYALKSLDAQHYDQRERALRSTDTQLDTHNEQLRRTLYRLPALCRARSIDELHTSIVSYEEQLAEHRGTRKNIIKQIEDDDHAYALYHREKIETRQDLYDQLARYRQQQSDAMAKRQFKIEYTSVEQAEQQFAHVHHELSNLIVGLDISVLPSWTRAYHQQLHAETTALQDKIRRWLNQQQVAAKTMERLEQDRNEHGLVCPNCQHVWYQEYTEDRYTKHRADYEQANEQLAAARSSMQELQERLDQVQDYFDRLVSYQRLIDQSPTLRPFWTWIQSQYSITTELTRVLADIWMAKSELTLHRSYNQLEEQCQQIQNVLNQQDSSGIQLLKDRREKNHRLLSELDRTILLEQTQLQQLQASLSAYRALEQARKELANLVDQRYQQLQLYASSLKARCVNVLIDSLEKALAQETSRYQDALHAQSRYQALDQQIQQEQLLVNRYAALIRALSPSEGLIAKGLKHFIQHFVGQMNQVIAQIWLYPLELLPPVLDEGALDYKFPVSVDGSVVSDLSKTSSAMKEVIQLAFQIVARQYLHLADAPIYLDEFAASMDHAHRASAYQAIQQWLGQTDVAQIYLISHYESLYASLQHTEVTVLCPNHIELPPNTVFNQHIQWS